MDVPELAWWEDTRLKVSRSLVPIFPPFALPRPLQSLMASRHVVDWTVTSYRLLKITGQLTKVVERRPRHVVSRWFVKVQPLCLSRTRASLMTRVHTFLRLVQVDLLGRNRSTRSKKETRRKAILFPNGACQLTYPSAPVVVRAL